MPQAHHHHFGEMCVTVDDTLYDPLATQPERKELGWEEDTGLLTLVFFLLYCRCNVEKVPCNSQLEIEGNRSGSALYSPCL